jgi:hypothetical protein
MSEASRNTMESGVWNTARTGGCNGRGEAVAEVDSRAHGEPQVLGGAVGMLKHGGGGVREDRPLSFHLGELVMIVRGRKVGCVSQGRDHGAERNIKVVRIPIELDGGPKRTASRMHARVKFHYVRENGRKGGNNCFRGWECKEPNVVGKVIIYTEYVFGSPRPCLLTWAEDVRAQCLKELSPLCQTEC